MIGPAPASAVTAGAERPPLPSVAELTYTADGPFPVRLSSIPADVYDPYNKYDQGRRKSKRMDGPLPDWITDQLRDAARKAPPSKRVQVPARTAGGVPGEAAPQSTAPTAGTGFNGIDINGCCGGGGSVPPDPEVAVGPNHIIVVVNVAIAVYNKSGTLLAGPTTLASFFSGTTGCNTSVFDPNVLYDESADRFIVGVDGNGSTYCVAATTGADPTGSWNRYGFATNFSNAFFDYPHAGVGRDAIYMGSNQFTQLGNYLEGRVFAMNKAALYAGTAMTVVSKSTGTNSTPQPANLHGYNQGTWPTSGPHYIMTEVYDGARHSVWTWTDPFSTNSFVKKGDVNLNTATGVTASFPIDWPQSGSSKLIQGNDWRGLDTEYRNGKIWMTGTVGCNPGGGTVNCIRWAQIDPAGPSVLQAGVYGSSGEHRVFPDLAVNHCDDMAIGFTKGSSGIYPSVYATGRQSGDTAGTLQAEVQLKAGERSYDSFETPSTSPRRWGDYSGMTIDPDGETFWYVGEYSENLSNPYGTYWGTYVRSMTYSCQNLTDTDGDGLSDSWELLHFGSLSEGAGDDPDGDGLTNQQEYDGGTDPAEHFYADVTYGHLAYTAVQLLANSGITEGCAGGNFCPDDIATRDLAAIWLVQAAEGGGYVPSSASGTVFGDVGVSDFAADWIEDAAAHQITTGCGGGNYCPQQALNKEQAALMLLKAKNGVGYTPPTAGSSPFYDVNIGSSVVFGDGDFAADWIVALYNQGYTQGCAVNAYCPREALTKAGFALMLARTFGLPVP